MATSSCNTEINGRIANADSFSSWKNGIDSQLTNTGITDATKNQIAANILTTMGCLQEKIGTVTTLPNDIATLQSDILALNTSIKTAEENVKIAKDRVAYIRNPDGNTSYYESWFPLDRPMRPISLPLIMAFTIAMGVMILLIISAALGYKVQISLPVSTYGAPTLLSRLRAQMTPAFWVVSITLIAVSVYAAKRN